jgi:Outer membrane protein beta-barrel domain
MKYMYRLIFYNALFLFLLVNSSPAFAQNKYFGIRLGYNNSILVSKANSTYLSRSSLFYGLVGGININSGIAIRIELIQSYQGMRLGSSYTLALHYANIPLLLELKNRKIIVESGPQVGILISAKDKYVDFEMPEPGTFKKIDLQWVFGIGYSLFKDLGINFRYNQGITNARKHGYEEAKNQVFQAGLFYKFKLKSKSK